MIKRLLNQFLVSFSDNPKSKIENPKWWGIFAIAFAFAFSGDVASAQQPKKIPRIGYAVTSETGADTDRFNGIRQRLRDLGYIEGQNIVIEYRVGSAKLERYHEVAAELVRLKVDIIVVGGGTEYVRVVKKATKTIPIVMTGPGRDPVESGVIESLARPGGNVTGITLLARDLGGKRLELLKEAVPKVARIALLYDSGNPGHQYEMKEVLPAAARALKLTLQPWDVKASDGFDKVFCGDVQTTSGWNLLPRGPSHDR
jgi:putative ABC transport system substrate-binding protein